APEAKIEECSYDLGGSRLATIELISNARPVSVSWERADFPAECYEPSAERDALEGLLARLEALESWLPADAWADLAVEPYEPHGYRMFIIFGASSDDFPSLPDLGTVDWPFEGALREFAE